MAGRISGLDATYLKVRDGGRIVSAEHNAWVNVRSVVFQEVWQRPERRGWEKQTIDKRSQPAPV